MDDLGEIEAVLREIEAEEEAAAAAAGISAAAMDLPSAPLAPDREAPGGRVQEPITARPAGWLIDCWPAWLAGPRGCGYISHLAECAGEGLIHMQHC